MFQFCVPNMDEATVEKAKKENVNRAEITFR